MTVFIHMDSSSLLSHMYLPDHSSLCYFRTASIPSRLVPRPSRLLRMVDRQDNDPTSYFSWQALQLIIWTAPSGVRFIDSLTSSAVLG